MKIKRKLDENLTSYINKLIDYSERFKNSNPFAPMEIEIPKKSKLQMRELNYRVDKLNEDPAKVANDFLVESGLIK